jgi:hypothetical protein
MSKTTNVPVGTVGLQAEIWIQDLKNKKQEC